MRSPVLREIMDLFEEEHEEFNQSAAAGYHETGSDLDQKVRGAFPHLADTDAGIRYPSNLLIAETKLRAMLSSLAPCTAKQYWRSWGNWNYYCEQRGIEPWFGSDHDARGEPLTDYIIREKEEYRQKPSTIRYKIDGIRFFHNLAGKRDFPQ